MRLNLLGAGVGPAEGAAEVVGAAVVGAAANVKSNVRNGSVDRSFYEKESEKHLLGA